MQISPWSVAALLLVLSAALPSTAQAAPRAARSRASVPAPGIEQVVQR